MSECKHCWHKAPGKFGVSAFSCIEDLEREKDTESLTIEYAVKHNAKHNDIRNHKLQSIEGKACCSCRLVIFEQTNLSVFFDKNESWKPCPNANL